MADRYSTPEMASIWSDETRYEGWLRVEELALEAMVESGVAPVESLRMFRSVGPAVLKIMQKGTDNGRDHFISLVTALSDQMSGHSKFLHRGMTSNDVIDTTVALQLRASCDQLLRRLDSLSTSLSRRAVQYKYTLCIGRVHGIHAEPITFGLKLIGWYSEIKRHSTRLENAREAISYGKIAGPVGNYSSLLPEVERHVLDVLELRPEDVPSQTLARDRHAEYASVLAGISAGLARFATEIRLLQQTEIREVHEGFPGGKGRATLPNKRNPSVSESIVGLARIVRNLANAAYDNMQQWHEGDATHLAAEFHLLPEISTLCDYMLLRFEELIEQLEVSPERMRENLESTGGTIFSAQLLAVLVDKGMSRDESYRLVSEHSSAAWEGGAGLEERLRADKRITSRIPSDVITDVFDYKRYTRFVDRIFDRVLG